MHNCSYRSHSHFDWCYSHRFSKSTSKVGSFSSKRTKSVSSPSSRRCFHDLTETWQTFYDWLLACASPTLGYTAFLMELKFMAMLCALNRCCAMVGLTRVPLIAVPTASFSLPSSPSLLLLLPRRRCFLKRVVSLQGVQHSWVTASSVLIPKRYQTLNRLVTRPSLTGFYPRVSLFKKL